MKKIIIIFVWVGFHFYDGIAQPAHCIPDYEKANLTTPGGCQITDAYYYNGSGNRSYTQQELNNIEAKLRAEHLLPNITLIAPPSLSYNCHGYAYANSIAWLGRCSPADLNSYYFNSCGSGTSASYIAAAESYATHVKYAGDHSAIRINSYTYRSKWGDGPVFEHAPDDVPQIYSPQGIKSYYIESRFITGVEEVCYGGSTFVLPASAETIYWTVSNSGIFTVNPASTTGTHLITVTRIGTGTGSVRLSARTGSASGPEVAYKNITPCTPPTISGASTVCFSGQQFTLSPSTSGITWTVTAPFSFSSSSNVTSTSGNPVTVYKSGVSNSNGMLKAFINGTEIDSKSIVPCFTVITGPDVECGSTATFTITNLPPGTSSGNVVWSYDYTLTPQGGNTGLSKTFTLNYPGNAWVQATVNGTNIGTYEFIAQFPSLTYHQKPLTCNVLNTLCPPSIPGITSYKWEVSGDASLYELNYSYGICGYVRFFNCSPSYDLRTVAAFAVSQCGESAYASHVYILSTGRGGGPAVAYPNPVSDILYIDLGQNAVFSGQLSSGTPTYDIRLYDSRGYMQRRTSAQGGIVQFNVSNLPNGIYFLHIYDNFNKIPAIQQIVVSH